MSDGQQQSDRNDRQGGGDGADQRAGKAVEQHADDQPAGDRKEPDRAGDAGGGGRVDAAVAQQRHEMQDHGRKADREEEAENGEPCEDR